LAYCFQKKDPGSGIENSRFGYKLPQSGYSEPRPLADLCTISILKHKRMVHQDSNAYEASSSKVWFITGTSRGFGRIWTEAALKRGDKVAATARKLESIADLNEKYGENVLTLELDVTDHAQAKKAVEQAHAHFGRLDIVFNNAGYSLVGTIEEASAEEVRALYETNVFGPLAVIRAALPLLRKQGGGHILGTSSNLGHVTLPVIGYYCSSKWAFEAIHESLAEEVKAFGIKVTIIEPGAYATEFGTPESLKFSTGMELYADYKESFFNRLTTTMERGNPEATPQALFQVVDAENPPLRFFLGRYNLPWVRTAYAERMEAWEAWESVSNSAQDLVK
jgi:NADP-dependent 3-hydroxy acid dehydrogenase YdfG